MEKDKQHMITFVEIKEQRNKETKTNFWILRSITAYWK